MELRDDVKRGGSAEADGRPHDDVSRARPEGGAGRKLTSSRQGPIVVAVTLLTTSLVVGLLVMEVWHRIGVVNLGYEMTRLTKERQQLLEERKRLKIEATVNARTERVDQIARESLGLESVRVDQIVRVPARRSTTGRPSDE